MLGYHLTSLDNWKQIKKEGLKPSLKSASVFPKDFKKYLKNGAIWIFDCELEWEQILGMIIWIIHTQRTDDIVQLLLTYNETQSVKYLYCKDNDEEIDYIKIKHTYSGIGHLGHDSYCLDLLTETIKPENITLLRHWNIQDWEHILRDAGYE